MSTKPDPPTFTAKPGTIDPDEALYRWHSLADLLYETKRWTSANDERIRAEVARGSAGILPNPTKLADQIVKLTMANNRHRAMKLYTGVLRELTIKASYRVTLATFVMAASALFVIAVLAVGGVVGLVALIKFIWVSVPF